MKPQTPYAGTSDGSLPNASAAAEPVSFCGYSWPSGRRILSSSTETIITCPVYHCAEARAEAASSDLPRRVRPTGFEAGGDPGERLESSRPSDRRDGQDDGPARRFVQGRWPRPSRFRGDRASELTPHSSPPRPRSLDLLRALDQVKADIDSVRVLGADELFFDPSFSSDGETPEKFLA